MNQIREPIFVRGIQTLTVRFISSESTGPSESPRCEPHPNVLAYMHMLFTPLGKGCRGSYPYLLFDAHKSKKYSRLKKGGGHSGFFFLRITNHTVDLTFLFK